MSFHVFFPNLSFLPKFVILVKMSNYQQPIFRHVIWQAIHYFLLKSLFSPNLSFLLNSPTVNMPLFVISIEYLAKPLMNFGILAIFAEICLYHLNLPFSYNHYLYKMPVFVLSSKFCQTFDRFFQKFVDFTKNDIFVKTDS